MIGRAQADVEVRGDLEIGPALAKQGQDFLLSRTVRSVRTSDAAGETTRWKSAGFAYRHRSGIGCVRCPPDRRHAIGAEHELGHIAPQRNRLLDRQAGSGTPLPIQRRGVEGIVQASETPGENVAVTRGATTLWGVLASMASVAPNRLAVAAG